jgi:hypothetical protein
MVSFRRNIITLAIAAATSALSLSACAGSAKPTVSVAHFPPGAQARQGIVDSATLATMHEAVTKRALFIFGDEGAADLFSCVPGYVAQYDAVQLTPGSFGLDADVHLRMVAEGPILAHVVSDDGYSGWGCLSDFKSPS